MRLKIASRSSDLARIQAFEVATQLRKHHPLLEIEHIFRASLGDQNQNDPLWKMPEKGVFTDDFVADLVQGSSDLVVHSWKDLPLEDRPQTEVVATLPRADQRDLLLVRKERWEKITQSRKLVVLSSSPRREYNLKAFLHDALPVRLAEVEFHPVRGNVPTRIKKLFSGEADALVLAKAALDRLLSAPQPEFQVLQSELREFLRQAYWMVLPLRENPTAAAQGALAIEIKKNRPELKELLQAINHQPTFESVTRERAQLQAYGGGCHQKIGISMMSRHYGDLAFMRGSSERGEVFHITRLQSKLSLQNGPVIGAWPLQREGVFQRESLPAGANPGRPLWIARSLALPETWRPSFDQLVWAAGAETWRKLAGRGVWVNGSAEGLGEQEDPGVEVVFGEKPQWLKLTHADAGPTDFEQLPTYRLIAGSIKPDFSHVTHFYWSSGSQFDWAVKLDKRVLDGIHACGPGNTFFHIQNRLGKSKNRLHIYLCYEDWKKEILR